MIRAVEGRPHSGGSYGPGLGPAGISLENVPGSTAACAGPALGGGPARRHPIPPQSAQPKDFTDQQVAATAATALGCHQRSHPQRTWILVEDSSTETAKRPWRSPPSLGRASRGRISSQIRGSLTIFQVLHKQHVKSRSGQRIAHRCVRGTLLSKPRYAGARHLLRPDGPVGDVWRCRAAHRWRRSEGHHGAVRRRAAAQRVRDQWSRLAALSFQQRAEEPCGRPPIAPRRHEDVPLSSGCQPESVSVATAALAYNRFVSCPSNPAVSSALTVRIPPWTRRASP